MIARRLRAFVPGLSRLYPPGHVAILRLYGPIAGGARTADWIELVRRLRESRRVPAVVLDIDSPGGSATASDDMFLALERLAAKKPLVAAITPIDGGHEGHAGNSPAGGPHGVQRRAGRQGDRPALVGPPSNQAIASADRPGSHAATGRSALAAP